MNTLYIYLHTEPTKYAQYDNCYYFTINDDEITEISSESGKVIKYIHRPDAILTTKHNKNIHNNIQQNRIKYNKYWNVNVEHLFSENRYYIIINDSSDRYTMEDLCKLLTIEELGESYNCQNPERSITPYL